VTNRRAQLAELRRKAQARMPGGIWAWREFPPGSGLGYWSSSSREEVWETPSSSREEVWETPRTVYAFEPPAKAMKIKIAYQGQQREPCVDDVAVWIWACEQTGLDVDEGAGVFGIDAGTMRKARKRRKAWDTEAKRAKTGRPGVFGAKKVSEHTPQKGGIGERLKALGQALAGGQEIMGGHEIVEVEPGWYICKHCRLDKDYLVETGKRCEESDSEGGCIRRFV